MKKNTTVICCAALLAALSAGAQTASRPAPSAPGAVNNSAVNSAVNGGAVNGTVNGAVNGTSSAANGGVNANGQGVNGSANINGTTSGNGNAGVTGNGPANPPLGATDANGNPITPGSVPNGSVNGQVNSQFGQNTALQARMQRTNQFGAQRTNQFGVVTNGIGRDNRFANRFGTNEFGVITNRFGAITNRPGMFGANTNRNGTTPTSNSGATNRFYGTNTSPAFNPTGAFLKDQAVSQSDQNLLGSIRRTIAPKLGSSPWAVPVQFNVQQNNVTVSGFVTTAEQKAQIVSMVKAVPGVVSVNDQLVVGTPAASGGATAGGTAINTSLGGLTPSGSTSPGFNGSVTTPGGNTAVQGQLSAGTNGVAPLIPPAAPIPPVAPQ